MFISTIVIASFTLLNFVDNKNKKSPKAIDIIRGIKANVSATGC